ncbi:VPLPA-CTERM sorting domain-containing protein [Roseobacter cerasinus]|uniref:VPLPA-CTERM sorting domain-containing protein n=1 Tax=Roseobacter cerasinus TaxID=2602289 RepID=UPI00135ADCAB|nr:VPLPA-CTERM sorting domain-containing protein [Roseobacter cerasinus]
MSAILAMSNPAGASQISLFYDHRVSEFSEPAGVTSITEKNYSYDAEFARHDQEFTSRSPCCVTGSAKNVLKNEGGRFRNDEFGSVAEIFVGDAGAEPRSITAGGQLIYAVQPDSPDALDGGGFRISGTRLNAIRGSTASLNFSIFLHEVPDFDAIGDYDDLLLGPTVLEAQYTAVLFGGDIANPTPSLTINQSGFDRPIPEPDFVMGNGSAVSWDLGIVADTFDLGAAGVDVDDLLGVSFNWTVKVESEFGGFSGPVRASFFDPLSGAGGLQFSSEAEEVLLTAPDTDLAPVPLPAGGILLISALAGLVTRARSRQSHA